MLLVQNSHFSNCFCLGNLGQENFFYDIVVRKNPFLGYKNKKFKNSKKFDIFHKRLTHGFAPKIAIFASFFFYTILARKISFSILKNEKTPFEAIKTRSSKSRKIDIFPTGLTHAFGPKMAIFPTLIFRQYRLRKCLLRYSRTKKHLSRL